MNDERLSVENYFLWITRSDGLFINDYDSVLSPSVAQRRKWTKCRTSETHRTPHFCLLIASVCACAPGKENEGWNLGRGNTLARWDFPYFPFDVIGSGGRDFFVGLRILLIYVVSTVHRVGSMFRQSRQNRINYETRCTSGSIPPFSLWKSVFY